MKRIIISLALAAVAAFGANAQIGVGVGYGTKTFSTNGFDDLGGLYVGATYNLELSQGLCVAPGVDLAFYSADKNNVKTKESYLAIPVLFNYAIPVADIIKIVPFAGPTVSLGLSSKTEIGSVSADRYDDTDYGRFDLLIGVGVALDVNDMIRVSVGYNKGLLNRNTGDGTKITTGGVHFGVAYLF